jgi:hypothetical protein
MEELEKCVRVLAEKAASAEYSYEAQSYANAAFQIASSSGEIAIARQRFHGVRHERQDD